MSRILKINLSPFCGDPIGAKTDRLDANAVMTYWSYAAIEGVIVLAVEILFTLGSIRLLVKVAAPSLVTIPPVLFKFT